MCTRGYRNVGKLVQYNISYLNCAYKIYKEYKTTNILVLKANYIKD